MIIAEESPYAIIITMLIMRTTIRTIICLALVSMLIGAGCRKEVHESSESPNANSTPARSPDLDTPEGVFASLRKCIESGRYEDAGKHIAPEQQVETVRLLLSVQEFVSAQQALADVLEDKIGPGTASTIDVRAAANIVGVLSRDVEFVDVEMLSDDRAVISCSIDKRVPLETVEMIREDGTWYLQTDPPIPQLIIEIRNLAQAIHRLTSELEKTSMTLDEFRKKQRKYTSPIIERIVALEAEQESKTDQPN